MGSSREIKGPSMGAGEMPAVGPGKAAMRTNPSKAENPNGESGSRSMPKGMKIEREGE